ncbi:MAG: peptidoglycan-binding domain-containing protein [bacterium]
MQKKSYQNELAFSVPQQRGGNNKKQDVMKIQSWLTLFDLANPGSGLSTGIDGDFGPATEKAVKNYQISKKLPATGIVDPILFEKLCEPLKTAFENPLKGGGLRELILNAARQHLASKPFELNIKGQSNSGPWVRSYMDGNEGEDWYWCMGFVQTIIDQAASSLGKTFKALMPLTYSCDTVGTTGINKGILYRYSKVRKDPSIVKPGDIFLVQKTEYDWTHTGIIINIEEGLFETIEGNTNDDGSSNGNRVCRRNRNFMQSKLDVFSVEPLV